MHDAATQDISVSENRAGTQHCWKCAIKSSAAESDALGQRCQDRAQANPYPVGPHRKEVESSVRHGEASEPKRRRNNLPGMASQQKSPTLLKVHFLGHDFAQLCSSCCPVTGRQATSVWSERKAVTFSDLEEGPLHITASKTCNFLHQLEV